MMKLDPSDYIYRLTTRPQDPESWSAVAFDNRTGKEIAITHYVIVQGYGFNLSTRKGCYNMAFSILVNYLQAFKDFDLHGAKRLIGEYPDALEAFYQRFLSKIDATVRQDQDLPWMIPVSEVSIFAKNQMSFTTVSPPEPGWLNEPVKESSMLDHGPLTACPRCGKNLSLTYRSTTHETWKCVACGCEMNFRGD